MNPPADDEFEISLFGPGYGECVVVHLGHGRWLVNDSCLNQAKTQPAALEYFERISVDYSRDVVLVVASHWHDDHVRGLARVVEACKSATFACSSALGKPQFTDLVKATGHTASVLGTGVDEFRKIIGIVGARQKAMPGALRLAGADMTVWADRDTAVRVHALSPSTESMVRALRNIGQLVPEVAEMQIRVPHLLPNHTSVVLWIDFGGHKALLGGDLETTQDHDRGWKSICLSNTRPHGKADVYKVAHHGSKTGHLDEIFTELLNVDPVSILAPFRNGSVALPTDEDKHRLCTNSSAVYTTSLKVGPVRMARDRTIERILRAGNARVELADPFCGQVQLRRRLDADSWSVKLFDPAGSLCSP